MTQSIKIEFSEYQIREYFSYNFEGKPIPREIAYNIYIKYPASLIVDSKKITFLVSAEIPKNYILDNVDPIKYLFIMSSRTLLNQIPRMKSLDIFSVHPLYVMEKLNKSRWNKLESEYKPMNEPFELKIMIDLYNNLLQNIYEYFSIRDIFQRVIDKLKKFVFDLTAFGFSTYRDEILSYVNFLRSCSEYSWGENCINILLDIHNDVIQLSKRKNENNFNYKSLIYDLQKQISILHPPEIWIKKPFISEEIKNKFNK